MLARRCLHLQARGPLSSPCLYSRHPICCKARHIETDSCGIPLQPTWSVNELLSSYPSPTISTTTFKQLHALSALIPPEEGTLEHDELKRELEDLVKLVEAVKLVKVEEVYENGDGRIWAEGTGIPLSGSTTENAKSMEAPSLLRHATRIHDGFYVVDADRTR